MNHRWDWVIFECFLSDLFCDCLEFINFLYCFLPCFSSYLPAHFQVPLPPFYLFTTKSILLHTLVHSFRTQTILFCHLQLSFSSHCHSFNFQNYEIPSIALSLYLRVIECTQGSVFAQGFKVLVTHA